MGGAAYNWSANSWDDEQFSSSSSNTVPTITDGTVQWTNSNGPQQYGYTSGNDWQDGANTAVRCEYYAEQVSGTANPYIAYLWCLSIGASSYSHQCGDGHTINRRWAWKNYANAGSYSPELTAFSAISNSTCNGSLSYVNTGLEEFGYGARSLRPTTRRASAFPEMDRSVWSRCWMPVADKWPLQGLPIRS